MHVAYSPEQQMPSDIVETVGLRHDGPVGERLTDVPNGSCRRSSVLKIERPRSFVEQKQPL
ncbi:hypothetical protein [Anoxybacillus flavithermus]|uniref:hypothetical protein n=1 Tax=Anoxybacillus flavithermus TaxID=33934 RepID=UPI0002F69659